MDLHDPITLLLPLFGILLILGAVWLTGGAVPARLDRDLLRRRLAEDLPDFAPAEAAIDADGAAAIAAGERGAALALAFVLGDRVAVRRLGAGEVRRIAVEGERLTIETDDFTRARIVLRLPGEALSWAARAERLLPGARAA